MMAAGTLTYLHLVSFQMRFNLQAQEEIAPGLRFWGMELSAIPVMIHLLLMMTDTHDALFESWTVMCVLVFTQSSMWFDSV
jgi:hypothetical protein